MASSEGRRPHSALLRSHDRGTESWALGRISRPNPFTALATIACVLVFRDGATTGPRRFPLELSPKPGSSPTSVASPAPVPAPTPEPKERVVGRHNPEFRKIQQKEEERRLERIRERHASTTTTAPPTAARKSLEFEVIKKIEIADDIERKYLETARKRFLYIDLKVNWEKLNVPMVMRNSATTKKANITVRFIDGIQGVRKAILEEFFQADFVIGSWQLNYVDPRRRKVMRLTNEQDWKDAVMFYMGKSPSGLEKPIEASFTVSKTNSKLSKVEKLILPTIEKNVTRVKKEKQKKTKNLSGAEKAVSLKLKEEKRKQKKQERRAQILAEKERREEFLQNLSTVVPEVPVTYPGIVWSPLLQQFETALIYQGRRVRLGTFKTREMAWSAICAQAKKEGIPLNSLENGGTVLSTSPGAGVKARPFRPTGYGRPITRKTQSGLGQDGRSG